VDHFIAEVEARDVSRNDSAKPITKDAIASIAWGAEELARALENQDISAVAAISQRLTSMADKHNIKDLGQATKRLGDLAAQEGDLIDLAASVGDLMELCRKTQRSYLNARDMRGPRAPGEVEQNLCTAVAAAELAESQ
jgi:hypothetical protein